MSSTIELEVQKARLAREILTSADEDMINNMWLFLQGNNVAVYQQKMPQKREIGFWEGKTKVIFHDDWEMTPEELLNVGKDEKCLCFVCEQVLAKDWLNKDEDEAWKNL